ncbi:MULTISPECIES: GlxA family transcriptional regulator [Streptomyces]|uniref:Helix-turn-helix domain-containing protein n=1 Tax=Streptomyces evansiae TaxID=3075535 RepID=A0ABU2R967_9ACTN|nr:MULTISPECIES: helix-turn-helix domain-containing protein [unclassified Streptomyces]EDY43126.2 AraC family transcriptional regulator [Streptomyces sp. SPB074]EFK98045.1 AraC family transcriptional regulator [Streptomyces sp. SPB78]MDT0413244.1 helix-turn-helix domain-containing protein [Streptomyces sp. DSM 41979]MYQ58139.1 helix-turn-helix domain-containing protein [Streptomyces sp. SID4926]SCE13309.1 Transcriptional regulator GlxA family, contains an amidase domain and an AraC-type DNA-bi
MVHHVVVLALDGVKPFDLGIPSQVLGQAFGASGHALYRVSTCSIGGRPVVTNQDFSISVEQDESALAGADTVVVATQDHRRGVPDRGDLPDRLAAALRSVPSTARVVSLCTSAFVLGAAGMLDGQRATTHWQMCDELARRFPRVTVDQNVLFVDNGRILTAAGAAAGLDLFLHLVRRDHGVAVANATARRCVVAPWREGGQAQFIERPLPASGDSSTSSTREWAEERLSQPLALVDLAAHAHMSVRTFTRRFRSEVGLSPHEWLLQRRLDHARYLLESTELSINEVSSKAGFTDPVLLRKHLRNAVGLTPGAYRRTYSAVGREAGASGRV